MEKYLEENALSEMMTDELPFAVALNLATLYEKNELYQEALREYTNLTNAKNQNNGMESFVRVNMGNIYFK